MVSQNELIDLPVVVELVAVPSSFDMDLFLSMREGAGMFKGSETNLEHVKFIAETIKASPWFILSKAPELTIQSAFFCLEVFRQLELTVDSNYSEAWDSKFRGRTWERESDHWNFQQADGRLSQVAFVMVIINLYRLVEDGILRPVLQKVAEVEERVENALETQKMLDKKSL
jgi:hypothetical protein